MLKKIKLWYYYFLVRKARNKVVKNACRSLKVKSHQEFIDLKYKDSELTLEYLRLKEKYEALKNGL